MMFHFIVCMIASVTYAKKVTIHLLLHTQENYVYGTYSLSVSEVESLLDEGFSFNKI